MPNETANPSSERPEAPEKLTSTTAPLSRTELVDKYREQALQKPNPLAANLSVINSDLMLFAGGIAESVSPLLPQLEGSPEAMQKFERGALLHMRVVQHITRVTLMEQQLEK